MVLRLSRVAEHRLVEVTHAMVAPLACDDRAGWLLEVNRRLGALFDAEVTLKVETRAGQISHVCEEDPSLAEAYQRFAYSEAGHLRSSDRLMDAALIAEQAVDVQPFTSGIVDYFTGNAVSRAPANQEIALRRGLVSSVGLRSPCAGGELMLVAFRRQEETKPFDRHALAMLRLLAPALGAGLLAVDRFDAGRKALWQLWDGSGTGVIVVTCQNAKVVYRNRTLDRMLAPTEGGMKLAGALKRMMVWTGRTGIQIPPALIEAGQGYRLSRSELPSALVAPDGAFLIQVEELRPRLPSADQLRNRWQLTPREAEVALLLAQGRSDAEIAGLLGLSPHTIRHHGERIYDKLGVRTRKALALHLLSLTAD